MTNKEKDRFGDLFKSKWTDENKYRKFIQGMDEAMSLLRTGKALGERKHEDFMSQIFGDNNPFGFGK